MEQHIYFLVAEVRQGRMHLFPPFMLNIVNERFSQGSEHHHNLATVAVVAHTGNQLFAQQAVNNPRERCGRLVGCIGQIGHFAFTGHVVQVEQGIELGEGETKSSVVKQLHKLTLGKPANVHNRLFYALKRGMVIFL